MIKIFDFFSKLKTGEATSKGELLQSILSEIKDDPLVGYAGFATKKDLHRYLEFAIFDKPTKNISYVGSKIDIDLINKTISKCKKYLPLRNFYLFIFPTFNKFVFEKMGGITGYTPWEGVVFIFIHPALSIKNIKRGIPQTLSHEYCHAVHLKYFDSQTLFDALVFEGLAEHFRAHITKIKLSSQIKLVSLRSLPQGHCRKV